MIFCNYKLISDQKKQLNIEIDQIKIDSNQKPVNGKVNIINVWEEDFVTTFGKPTIPHFKDISIFWIQR